MSSPLLLTQALAERTGTPSDIRQGEVVAVSARGVDVQVATGLIEAAGHLTSYSPAVGDTVTMISYANSWVVLGRVLGPGTPTDLASPGTAMGLTLLDGMVLSGSGATVASSSGSQVSIPRHSLNFYHPPNHWVMLLLDFNWYSLTTGDWIEVRMVEASSGRSYFIQQPQITGGFFQFCTWPCVTDQNLGGAQRSWSLTLQRISGSGIANVMDMDQRRGAWLAIDLGPYPNVIRVA